MPLEAVRAHSSIHRTLEICICIPCLLSNLRLLIARPGFCSVVVALHTRLRRAEKRNKLSCRLLVRAGSVQVSVDSPDHCAHRRLEGQTGGGRIRNGFTNSRVRFDRVGGLAEYASLSRLCSPCGEHTELWGSRFRDYAESARIVDGLAVAFSEGGGKYYGSIKCGYIVSSRCYEGERGVSSAKAGAAIFFSGPSIRIDRLAHECARSRSVDSAASAGYGLLRADTGARTSLQVCPSTSRFSYSHQPVVDRALVCERPPKSDGCLLYTSISSETSPGALP